MNPQELYGFWFGGGNLRDKAYLDGRMGMWFAKNEKMDAEMRGRFAPWLEKDLSAWKAADRDLLCLIVLYDQIPRNSFRGTGRMFAYDDKARGLAREAVARGLQRSFTVAESLFIALPFEHSEDRADQDESIRLCEELLARAAPAEKGFAQGTLDYAEKHRVIIGRFGRFPHRNALLGRRSTPEEVAFLKGPDSSF